MLRVVNLEASLKFYCEGLGFKLMSRREHNEGRFTLAFLRAPSDADNGPMIELTHNWDTDRYVRGEAFGHTAYEVESILEIQARLKKHGYDLSWGPGKTPSGDRSMAFVDDPDGFEIELLENRS